MKNKILAFSAAFTMAIGIGLSCTYGYASALIGGIVSGLFIAFIND